MKLYFAPHTCSFVPHIVLRELGLEVDLIRVDLRDKSLAGGGHLEDVDPKSYVPVLVLNDGTVLTEVAIILGHLAETHADAKLTPPRDAPERRRFDELLHFISTELHKSFLMFTLMPNPGDEAKEWGKKRLVRRVSILESALGDKPYFAGADFTVLDAYAYWALGTFKALTRHELPTALAEYVQRIGERPSVKAAVEAEKRAPRP